MLEIIKTFPKFTDPKCAGTGDLFFPDSQHQWEEATLKLRQICGSCSHKIECLDYALENIVEEGFWGGMTPKERKAISTREKEKNRRYREVQELISLGLDEEEIAKKLGIKKSSLKRVFLRARKKGLIK